MARESCLKVAVNVYNENGDQLGEEEYPTATITFTNVDTPVGRPPNSSFAVENHQLHLVNDFPNDQVPFVPAGTYSAHVEVSGYNVEGVPESLELQPNACAEVGIKLHKQGQGNYDNGGGGTDPESNQSGSDGSQNGDTCVKVHVTATDKLNRTIDVSQIPPVTFTISDIVAPFNGIPPSFTEHDYHVEKSDLEFTGMPEGTYAGTLSVENWKVTSESSESVTFDEATDRFETMLKKGACPVIDVHLSPSERRTSEVDKDANAEQSDSSENSSAEKSAPHEAAGGQGCVALHVDAFDRDGNSIDLSQVPEMDLSLSNMPFHISPQNVDDIPVPAGTYSAHVNVAGWDIQAPEEVTVQPGPDCAHVDIVAHQNADENQGMGCVVFDVTAVDLPQIPEMNISIAGLPFRFPQQTADERVSVPAGTYGGEASAQGFILKTTEDVEVIAGEDCATAHIEVRQEGEPHANSNESPESVVSQDTQIPNDNPAHVERNDTQSPGAQSDSPSVREHVAPTVLSSSSALSASSDGNAGFFDSIIPDWLQNWFR